MTTTARENIINYIETQLKTIAPSTYKTTVTKVQPYLRSLDVSENECPYVCFGLGRARYTNRCFGWMEVEEDLIIAARLDQKVYATRVTAINNLIDDIVACMNADTTLNGNAMGIWQTEHETDEQDPDAAEDLGGFIVTFWVIKYRRSTSST